MAVAGAVEEVAVGVEEWAAAGASVGDFGARVVVVDSEGDMTLMDTIPIMAIHPIDALQS